MFGRMCLAGIASALLVAGSTAWAADSDSSATASPAPFGVSDIVNVPADGVATPIFADDATTSPPLMMGLEHIDDVGKTLESWNISIGGYVDIGYMYDLTKPRDGGSSPAKTPPADDIYPEGMYKNAFDLDQVDLNITKSVDATKGKWDWGFTIEGNFGRDDAFTHSNGIYDNTVKHGTGGFSQPDLEQAFLTFAIPVGGGIKVTAGKFVTLLGEETINPTTNLFYSHSYAFSYGEPLTETGVLGTYYFNSAWNATAGITRGWNESTDDNNGDPDFIGQVSYAGDKLTSLNFNVTAGPEGYVGTLPYNPTGFPKDNKDLWVVPEITGSYKLADQLTASADLLYGFANNQSQWYGAVAYLSYVFSPQITVNARGEFYHDGHSATIFAGELPGLAGGRDFPDVNYYEATLGVDVTPMPNDPIFKNLSIRPEIRYDLASKRALDPAGVGGHYTELTAAVDAFMKY